LQIGGHGVLPIDLILELTDHTLLLLNFRLQFRNFIALDLDKGLEASRVGITGVI
jgi:hypothetical protein